MEKPQILVVEDSRTQAKYLQDHLTRLGFIVPAIVSSAEEAITYLSNEPYPNLILMDIELKGETNGVEAAEQIRTQFDIPIIYLTAQTDPELLHQAKITEPFGYLVKLFEHEQFERELQITIELALYKHEMEAKLKKQKEELSSFAHQMAHDLKGNLTAILLCTHLLHERGYDKPLVEMISKHAQHVTELLNHSLELADAGLVVDQVDEVDFNQLVESIAQSTLPQNITLAHNTLPKLTCDRNRVRQIFKNLFNNAVTHGETTTSINVTSKETKDGIILLIANDGLPIPSEWREKIFQQGFTSKKGNLGLGLSIVKKLVEGHGWLISLEPTSEVIFRITIPLAHYRD